VLTRRINLLGPERRHQRARQREIRIHKKIALGALRWMPVFGGVSREISPEFVSREISPEFYGSSGHCLAPCTTAMTSISPSRT
jgi:hypothetical protein